MFLVVSFGAPPWQKWQKTVPEIAIPGENSKTGCQNCHLAVLKGEMAKNSTRNCHFRRASPPTMPRKLTIFALRTRPQGRKETDKAARPERNGQSRKAARPERNRQPQGRKVTDKAARPESNRQGRKETDKAGTEQTRPERNRQSRNGTDNP